MRLRGRCALVHLQLHLQKIRRDVREEHEAQDATCQQADRENQQRDENRECQVAMLQGPVEEGDIVVIDEVMQPLAEKALEADEDVVCVLFVMPDLHMRQVGGQDQFRLHQGKCQAQDHHPANGGKKLAGDARNHQYRDECRDGCQYAESSGHGDFHHPLDNVVDRVALRPDIGIGAFTDDNGVVHHDTQHQDEAEQAQHVDGDIHCGHQEKRAHEGDRQANHHPECQFQAQEQGQDQKYQGGAQDQVLDHHVETAFEVVTDIRPGRQGDTFGQGGGFILHPLVHRCGYVQLALAADR